MFQTERILSNTNLSGRVDNSQLLISNSLSDVSDDTTSGTVLRGFLPMFSFSNWVSWHRL